MQTHTSKTIAVSLGLIFVALAALFLLTAWFDALLIPWFYSKFSRELAEFTRLNPHAVKMLAAFVVLIGALIARAISPAKDFLGSGKVRRLVFTILAFTALFNGLRWATTANDNFDRAGENLRWYIIRSDGSVRYYFEDGIDRESGRPLLPVTPDIWPTIEAYRKGQLTKVNPEEVPWFTRNGQPNLWYWKGSSGQYEFWSGPGYHPFELEELRPVDRATRDAWLESSRKAKEQVSAAIQEAAAKRLADQRALREKESQLAAARTRLTKIEEEKKLRAQKGSPSSEPSNSWSTSTYQQSESKTPSHATSPRSAPSSPTPGYRTYEFQSYRSYARIRNETRLIISVSIKFPEGWRTRRMSPGHFWTVGVPQGPVLMRWNDGRYDRQVTLPSSRLSPPYPNHPAPSQITASAFRLDHYSRAKVVSNLSR